MPLRTLWRRPWLRACAIQATTWGVRLLALTLRPVYVQQQFEQCAFGRGVPLVVAVWHGRIFYFLRHYYRQRHHFTVLVSRSRDGEFISQVLQSWGTDTTRGSSSRGGMRALLELVRKMRQGSHAMIIPDGPRGPRYRVQPGIMLVAEKTGAAILPVTYNARWKKVLTSWDRFVLPLPFSRVVVVFGEPIQVPAATAPEHLQATQRELESSLQAITALADAYFSS